MSQAPSLPKFEIAIADQNGVTAKAWYFFFQAISAPLAAGLSVTITTAELTTGGTQGSMTFTNGVLTAQVQAT